MTITSTDLFPSITAPVQSYSEFVESLPSRRAPQAADIFLRWDERIWKCVSRDKILLHTQPHELPQGTSAGKCLCGIKMTDIGPVGIGERRAYLGWLLGIMEPEEASLFAMSVLRPDVLLQIAMVPVVQAVYKHIKGV